MTKDIFFIVFRLRGSQGFPTAHTSNFPFLVVAGKTAKPAVFFMSAPANQNPLSLLCKQFEVSRGISQPSTNNTNNTTKE